MSTFKLKPTVTKKLYKVMQKQLHEGMCSHFDDILAEGSLASALHKATQLKEEASRQPDGIAWRPPGDVNLHLQKPDAIKVLEETTKLEEIVEKKEAENARLMKKIAEKRAKIRLVENKVDVASKILPTVISRSEESFRQRSEMYDTLDILDGQ